MYQEQREIWDDDIVIDFENLFRKARLVLHRRWYVLAVLFILGFAAAVSGILAFCKPAYQCYVTYQVTLNGDEAADAVAASMLGSQMPVVFESTGLKDMLTEELEQSEVESDWLDADCLSSEYSSSTNLFTLYVKAGSPDKAMALLDAVESVMPVYAANQLGRVTLIKIDENVDCEEPASGFGKVKTACAGVLFGTFLAGLYAVFAVLGNRMVCSKEDMKAISSLLCIGELEEVRTSSKKKAPISLIRITKHNRRYAENMRALRHKVETALAEQGNKVFMITSSVSGEGKTTISCNLALTLARNEKKVILIDTDLYHAGVSEQLQPKTVKKNLADYLKGRASEEEIICHDLPIDVIYGNAEAKVDGLLLGSRRMEELISRLKEEYDYVVLDTAPAALRSDADILTKQADAVLFVVGCGAVSKGTVEKGLHSILGDHIQSIGYVLNGTDETSRKYAGAYYK